MKRSTVIVVLIVAIALYSLINALLGDLLVGDVQTFLHNQFGDNDKKVIWGVAIVVLIIGAAISVYYFLNQGKEGAAKQKKEALQKDVLEDVRNGLAESYQSRIDSKLAYRYPINLQLKYSKEGTNTREDLINRGVKTYGAGTIKDELIKIFDQQGGRLLIIGEPGSGKTTIMLQLALKLLERKEEQVPVVVNIATWRARFKNVEEWFEELLPQMGFSTGLVKTMLQENRILPLFDGLDELAEAGRDSCLAAIAYYGKRQSVRYVICSRIKEYANAADAPVFCQVMVKPLTLKQIKAGLKATNSPEANGILDAINKDSLLAKAIEVPFYLNTVQLLFASMKGVGEFGFVASDVAGRQREIETAFVEDALGGLKDYPKEDAKKWLTFLADRMGRRGMVRFELVDMQYDWGQFGTFQMIVALALRSGLSSFVISLGFALFLLTGTIIIQVNIPTSLMIMIAAVSLVFWFLLNNSIYDIFQTVRQKRIEVVKVVTREKVSFPIKEMILSITPKMKNMLFMIIFVTIFLMLSAFLAGFFIVEEKYLESFSLWGLCKFGFILFSILFLFLLFTSIIAAFLQRIENGVSYLQIRTPYQRFYASIYYLYFSIAQHWHLCYLLRKKGLLVRNYPVFLKAAIHINVLESDGGSWRFRHRILQEYFVGVWLEKYGADEALADGLEGEKEQE